MPNITITVSESAYRHARLWAAERGTSVSRIVQYMLETLPGIRRLPQVFPVPNQLSPGQRALAETARKALEALGPAAEANLRKRAQASQRR